MNIINEISENEITKSIKKIKSKIIETVEKKIIGFIENKRNFVFILIIYLLLIGGNYFNKFIN